MVPRKKIKTQSVKQKCFESITQSIRHLRKPKIKSYPIQKRKTDKPNVIITIVYPELPLLGVSRGKPPCHIAWLPCNIHTRCAIWRSLSHRGQIPYPGYRRGSRQTGFEPARLRCKAWSTWPPTQEGGKLATAGPVVGPKPLRPDDQHAYP